MSFPERGICFLTNSADPASLHAAPTVVAHLRAPFATVASAFQNPLRPKPPNTTQSDFRPNHASEQASGPEVSPMLSRYRLILALFLAFCAIPHTAHAQFGVYAMGSGGFVGSSTAASTPSFHIWGGTFGVYDDFLRLGPIKLGSDLRYFQESSSNSNGYDSKLHGGLAGLRLSLKLPLVPPKPYIQAEIGGVGTNYGVDAHSSGSFAYQVQGGLDFTVFPHLNLRAEYGGGEIGAASGSGRVSLQEVGFGGVLRF